jgi:hypothetical protein
MLTYADVCCSVSGEGEGTPGGISKKRCDVVASEQINRHSIYLLLLVQKYKYRRRSLVQKYKY